MPFPSIQLIQNVLQQTKGNEDKHTDEEDGSDGDNLHDKEDGKIKIRLCARNIIWCRL